jgi:hypothetical protein
MQITYKGLIININEYDHRSITIDMPFFTSPTEPSGGLCRSDGIRPPVEVKLNNIVIHEMFDESDDRWKNEQTTN